MPNRLLLKPAEAAEALGLSRSKIYTLIAQRKLPSVKVDGALRVPRAALERWIAKNTKTIGIIAAAAVGLACM